MVKNCEKWVKKGKTEEKPETGSRQGNERQQETPAELGNRKPETGNGEKCGKMGNMWKNGEK